MDIKDSLRRVRSTGQRADVDVQARSRAWLPPASLLGFGVALVAVLAIALTSVGSLNTRYGSAERVSQATESIERLQALFAAMQDSETGQRGFLLTGEASYLEPFLTGKAATKDRLERLRATLADDAQQSDRLLELARLIDIKHAEMQQTIDLYQAGKPAEAMALVRSNVGKITMDRMRALSTTMMRLQDNVRRTRQEAWQEAADSSMRIALTGSGLLLVLVLIGAGVSARQFRAAEDEAWLRATQGAFGQQLQGELRVEVLAERVMAFLSRALSAPAGAFYVSEGDGSLRRWGGHALTPDGSPERVQLGEGLVGQAARGTAPVHLTDLPADHLPLASGTGRSRPRELVLAPARHEGRLEALVELAFLQRVDKTTLALLERVSEILAIAVRSARDRTRLEELLEETQRQAEELQAQQEELRVSNEELDEQGRVLRESQAALEMQQTELERSNAQLAQHAGALEQQQRALLRNQSDLQAQSEALAQASHYKSEFLANMSHELRTPLNSALILSQLLSENRAGNLTPEQVRFATAIHDANNDLLMLINDVLDLSKIEAGHLELLRQDVPLNDVAKRLRAMFEPMASKKALRLTITVEQGAPGVIVSDEQRLMQVLKNLLSNAIKFTARGEVSLQMRAGDPDGVWFDVRDTGPGIAADKHELIFEAFRQADGSTSREFGGTGLGLSISRELVQRLGGKMELRSAPGAGSTFSVWMPLELSEDPAAQGVTPGALPGKSPAAAPLETPGSMPPATSRVLSHAATSSQAPPPPSPSVSTSTPTSPAPSPMALPSGRRMLLAVEDDGRFAEVLKRLVEEQGFDCTVAGTGDQALKMARELRPSGILLDVGLPDQSGLSVLERLKRDGLTRHIPVHVVSSHERSQAALAMGAIGHLVKPAGREQLIDAIRLLEQKLDQPVRRVLVVEDDPGLRRSLQELLAGPQIEIVSVGLVADALKALATTSFDCMVTDLALPDGSGFDLLERMSASDQLGFPPVIVYTGRALSRDEETRLRRQSRSIIVKGARSPERLLDEVTLFLHSVEAQLPTEQRRLLGVARSRDSVLEGRCILLAEDDVRNIFALDSVFEPQGVRLEIARNGREAVEKVTAMGTSIDLILMDVMMPEMDGLEAMRRIRRLPGLAQLPIIALTAKAMSDDRQQCIEAGANDYLAKPIDIDRLLSLCRVWMPA